MSAQCFTQVQPSPWPSGHGEMIAMLAISPESLGAGFGLRFTGGSDNLDCYLASAVRLGSGRVMGLMRHRGTPAPGTELHVDSGDDFRAALCEFLGCFGFTANDLAWVREEVPLDHLQMAEGRRS